MFVPRRGRRFFIGCRKSQRHRDVCEDLEEKARGEITSMNVPSEILRRWDGIFDSYSIRKVCYEQDLAAKQRRDY